MRIIGIFTVLLSLSLFSSSLCAQGTIKYESSFNQSNDSYDNYYEGEYYLDPDVFFYAVNLSDSVALDKAILRVTYEARIVRDTTDPFATEGQNDNFYWKLLVQDLRRHELEKEYEKYCS